MASLSGHVNWLRQTDSASLSSPKPLRIVAHWQKPCSKDIFKMQLVACQCLHAEFEKSKSSYPTQFSHTQLLWTIFTFFYVKNTPSYSLGLSLLDETCIPVCEPIRNDDWLLQKVFWSTYCHECSMPNTKRRLGSSLWKVFSPYRQRNGNVNDGI